MQMKEARIFFGNKKPTGGIILLGIGLICFWFCITIGGSFMGLFVGIAMIALGIYRVQHFYSLYSEKSIDGHCEKLSIEYLGAKKKLMDCSDADIIENLFFNCYSFENLFSARLSRRGKDGIWRSSICEMTSVFVTHKEIYFWRKKISLISDEKLEEEQVVQLGDIQVFTMREENNVSIITCSLLGNQCMEIKSKDKEKIVRISNIIKEKRDISE